MKFYCLFDNERKSFNRPFESIDDISALRLFKSFLHDEKYKEFSDKLTLYYLGEFDDKKGEFINDKREIKFEGN